MHTYYMLCIHSILYARLLKEEGKGYTLFEHKGVFGCLRFVLETAFAVKTINNKQGANQ
jgi:hypothetical protein